MFANSTIYGCLVEHKIKEFALFLCAPVMISIMAYISTPQTHSMTGAFRCAFITAMVSVLIGAWVWEDPNLTEGQKFVIVFAPSILSDFLLVGIFRVLAAFKADPFGTISRGFKSFRGK